MFSGGGSGGGSDSGSCYIVRSVVAKSGGVLDGHFVTLTRHDSGPHTQWWLMDDDSCRLVRRTPADRAVRLSDDPVLAEYMPCFVCCERVADVESGGV